MATRQILHHPTRKPELNPIDELMKALQAESDFNR